AMSRNDTARLTVDSPLGQLTISEREGRIVALSWGGAPANDETPLLLTAAQQLHAYFYCELKQFDLKLAPAGAPFDQAVWQEMRAIPRGRTLRYGQIAQKLGGDARDVGVACARNPIPIIIPCHRVLASGGKMGGYSGAGGAKTKRFLLELEGAAPSVDDDDTLPLPLK